MSTKMQKVGASCFVGGMLTLLSLIILVPSLHWIGMIICAVGGALFGYMFHDFKAVLRAIPIAWHYAVTQLHKDAFSVILFAICVVPHFAYLGIQWLASKPRPRWMIHSFAGCVLMLLFFFYDSDYERSYLSLTGSAFLVWLVSSIVWWIFLDFFIVGVLLFGVTDDMLGDSVNSYWERKANIDLSDVGEFTFEIFGEIKWKHALQLYAVALLNIVFVQLHPICAFIYFVGCALWIITKLGFSFAWKLFDLIHSNERIVVAVDTPLGAFLTYGLIRAFAGDPILMQPWIQLLLCFAGGLASAGLGMLNYKLMQNIHWIKNWIRDMEFNFTD